MPIWIFIALGALALLLLGVLAVGNGIATYILRQPRETRERAEAVEIERENLAPGELDALPLEEFTVKTADGLALRCAWLRCGKPTKRAVVAVHGHGSRCEHVLKYAKLYTARGYDALLFDHRSSGGSEGRHTTMGYLERHDLAGMIALARAEKGEGAFVGVHGESMGGATVLLAACMDGPPDFVVADCPYGDLTEEAAFALRSLHRLPAWPFLPVASLFVRLRAGFSLADVSPLREIRERGGVPDVPIRFIHGTADALVPHSASEALYAAKGGKKDILIVPGAQHARCITRARAEYAERVYGFLERFTHEP